MEAASIKEEYVSNLAVSTDYCVIDTTTQTILKNTTREPELLVTEENSAYAYYLVLRYDQNGRLADIKVKGNNTEQFIKNVQLAANSTDTLCMSDCDKSTQVVYSRVYTKKSAECSLYLCHDIRAARAVFMDDRIFLAERNDRQRYQRKAV